MLSLLNLKILCRLFVLNFMLGAIVMKIAKFREIYGMMVDCPYCDNEIEGEIAGSPYCEGEETVCPHCGKTFELGESC